MSTNSNSSKREHTESTTIDSSVVKNKAYFEANTALGVTKFKELIEKSTVFIDKSLLIKEFLKDSAKYY